MLRAVLAVVLVAAVAFAVTLTGVGPAPARADMVSAHEDALVQMVNDARAKIGLTALEVTVELQEVARWRSRIMATEDWGGHRIPAWSCGYVNEELDQRGIVYARWGENWGWSSGLSAEWMFEWWMSSPVHRDAILSASFTGMGVGAYVVSDWYFGERCSETWPGAGNAWAEAELFTIVFIQKRVPSTAAPSAPATPRPIASATPRPIASATPRPGVSATPRPSASATPRPGVSAPVSCETAPPRRPPDL